MNLPLADTIYLHSNKFVTGVKIEAKILLTQNLATALFWTKTCHFPVTVFGPPPQNPYLLDWKSITISDLVVGRITEVVGSKG